MCMMPPFTAQNTLQSAKFTYAACSKASSNSASKAVLLDTTRPTALVITTREFPCVEKVKDAQCMSDSSGIWRCQLGFPGQTCYNIRSHFGHYSCSPTGGYPPCDKYGCGVNKVPHSYSQSCRVECYFSAGVCNFAEATVECPMKYDVDGNKLGRACCTERESDQVRGQACQLAWSAIRSNPGCKTNCREI